jgi:hypothetical protein
MRHIMHDILQDHQDPLVSLRYVPLIRVTQTVDRGEDYSCVFLYIVFEIPARDCARLT